MFEKSFLVYCFVLIFHSIVGSKGLNLEKPLKKVMNLMNAKDLQRLRNESQKESHQKNIIAWLNGVIYDSTLLSQCPYQYYHLEVDVITQKIKYQLNNFYILEMLRNDLSNDQYKQMIDFNLCKLEGLIKVCEKIFSNIDVKRRYSSCFFSKDFRFLISFSEIKENLPVFLKKNLCYYKYGFRLLWQGFQEGSNNDLERQIIGFFYFIHQYFSINNDITTDRRDNICNKEYVCGGKKDIEIIGRLKEGLLSFFFISEIMEKSKDYKCDQRSINTLILEKSKFIYDNYSNYIKVVENDSGNLGDIDCFSIEKILDEFRYSDFVAVKREFEASFKDEKNADDADMMVLFLKKNKDHSFFSNVFFDKVIDSLYLYNVQKGVFQGSSEEFNIKSKKDESFSSNCSCCCQQTQFDCNSVKKSEVNNDDFSPFIQLNLSYSLLYFSVFDRRSQIMFSSIYFKNSICFGILLKTTINSSTKISISLFSSFLFFASISFELFADFYFLVSFCNQKRRLFLGFLYSLANDHYSVDLHCGYFFE